MYGPVSTTEPHGLAILLFSHSFHAMVLTSALSLPDSFLSPGMRSARRPERCSHQGLLAGTEDPGTPGFWRVWFSLETQSAPTCFSPLATDDGHLERRARDHEQKLGLRVSCPIRSHSGPLRRGGRRATNLGAHRQTWEEAGAS